MTSDASETPGPGFGGALRQIRLARGLSQLELAGLAGSSQRHISFIESGRSQPSREMVLTLAQALGLPLRQRNRLLVAAGFAAAYPQRGLDDAAMAPLMDALRRMLRHHKPYPAIVVNRRWDLVLMNGTVVRLFGLVADGEQVWRKVCPDGRRNILRMIFHPDGLRPLITNFDEVARMLLGYLQREAAQSAGAAAVLEEVLRDTGLPRQIRVAEALPQPVPVFTTNMEALGVQLRFFTMISTFGTPQDVTADELRVGSFYPADEASEKFLRELAREDGEAGPVPG